MCLGSICLFVCQDKGEKVLVMLIIAFKLYMIIVQAMWYEFETCSRADHHDEKSDLDAEVTYKVQESHDSNCVIN